MGAPNIASPLVSTEWLADHLGSEKLVVLDATVLAITHPNGRSGHQSGHDQYLVRGHIPGALFADVMGAFSDPDGKFGFPRPTSAGFEGAAGALGIDNDTTVVVYDAVVGQWAARIWWLFRAFGYDRVAVLDGGMTKWQLEERELEFGHIEPVPSRFAAAERPELWADKAEVERIVKGESAAALVCALPPREFAGEEGSRARLGHIPGSISVPAGRIVDRESRAFLPEAELRAALAPAIRGQRMVTYCSGGIAASSDALVLVMLGEDDVAVYDGSLNEWVADPAMPVVTTAQ